MKIITGSTGTAHITSNNDGEFNQGIFGDGLVVLANGNKLTAQIKDANTITIKDGDLILQGRHALIEPNTTEDVTIQTGSVGKKRIDLIVARYELNDSTGYESISLVVKTGAETTGVPAEPSYTIGNIRTGSLVAEMPLYKVNVDGITISSVVACFSVKDYLNTRLDKTEQKGSIIEGEWTTRVVPSNTSTNVARLTLNPNKKYLVVLNGKWNDAYDVPFELGLESGGSTIGGFGNSMKYKYFNYSAIVQGKSNINVYAYVTASGGNLNINLMSNIQAIEL